ncbi:unnamed protein product [Adineta ricciae]|uniref:Uncharacterized protein n=1 Tax=Adineta ricciae TaxID=249248 RepID=A0A815MDE5_ADIRI|nr:unnamed protein product [Adineta ricciae]
MWYPVHQQQQQHSCYGYTHHHPSHQQQQQQQTYLRTSYYCNTDELSTTCVEAINDENDSSNHCQTTYSGSAHVTTANYYVTPSFNPYGDEMSSHQTATTTTTTTRKTYWNPVIVAPNRNMNMLTPSMSTVSSSSLSHTSSCWDWLLYSPQYYSEFYTPSSTYTQQQKFDEEDDKENDHDWSFLTSLPTCLLSLLCLTPQLIQTSDDENDSDQEMNIVHSIDESSLLLNHVDATRLNNISSNLLLSSINTTKPNVNRSPTPETDDGYQSANDASRSDYSQPSSVPYDHHSSKDDISINEHSLPKPLMPRRISYAAAAKPITTTPSPTTKISSLSAAVSKPKQTINKILTGITTTNDISSTNGQKSKFIAPRFERMHHAKQHSSSSITTIVKPSSTSTASNRTQTRSTNINNNNNYHQRNHMMNSTRRR